LYPVIQELARFLWSSGNECRFRESLAVLRVIRR
jgi:hypothetical protein